MELSPPTCILVIDMPSLHQSVPKVVAAPDVNNVSQVGILVHEHSVTLAHEVAVVDQLLVEVVQLAFGVKDAHA